MAYIHQNSDACVQASLTVQRPSFARLVNHLLTLIGVRKSRNDLANLPDHLLEDIGVSREAALAEAAKPVWDAPDHWGK